jgi:hypothetical protein
MISSMNFIAEALVALYEKWRDVDSWNWKEEQPISYNLVEKKITSLPFEGSLSDLFRDAVPVCASCEEHIEPNNESFCFIGRLDRAIDNDKMNMEIYHPECFMSNAGQNIYDRLAPLPVRECPCCTLPTFRENFCKECEAAETKVVLLCDKCEFHPAERGSRYCKSCKVYFKTKNTP